jgi:hypothetical protein
MLTWPVEKLQRVLLKIRSILLSAATATATATAPDTDTDTDVTAEGGVPVAVIRSLATLVQRIPAPQTARWCSDCKRDSHSGAVIMNRSKCEDCNAPGPIFGRKFGGTARWCAPCKNFKHASAVKTQVFQKCEDCQSKTRVPIYGEEGVIPRLRAGLSARVNERVDAEYKWVMGQLRQRSFRVDSSLEPTSPGTAAESESERGVPPVGGTGAPDGDELSAQRRRRLQLAEGLAEMEGEEIQMPAAKTTGTVLHQTSHEQRVLGFVSTEWCTEWCPG